MAIEKTSNAVAGEPAFEDAEVQKEDFDDVASDDEVLENNDNSSSEK